MLGRGVKEGASKARSPKRSTARSKPDQVTNDARFATMTMKTLSQSRAPQACAQTSARRSATIAAH